MNAHWLYVIVFVCSLGVLACALALRYQPNRAWRVLIIVFSATLIVTSIASIRHRMQRDDKYAHIRTEQDDVQRRLDLLQAEIANNKGPVDASAAKEHRERVEALQRDLDAIRKESEDLKRSK
jgi:hypothetical protein